MKLSTRSASVVLVTALALSSMRVPTAFADDDPSAQAVASQVTSAADDNGDPEPQQNGAVTVPANGAQDVQFGAPGEFSLGLPASGAGMQGDDLTTVYDGDGADNQIAVQPTAEGLRALVSISDKDAPEDYDFDLGGLASQLQLQDDGSVNMLDAAGQVIGNVPAPWATDANGTAVPTHYEVNGLTLTQVVEHREGNYSYGITADPNFVFWVKCAAAVTEFFAENGPIAEAKIFRVFRDAGELVKILKRFKNIRAAMHGMAALLGELSGLDTLIMRCTP